MGAGPGVGPGAGPGAFVPVDIGGGPSVPDLGEGGGDSMKPLMFLFFLGGKSFF
jgi:hypothetical protein